MTQGITCKETRALKFSRKGINQTTIQHAIQKIRHINVDKK
jgi:hypothetical protein